MSGTGLWTEEQFNCPVCLDLPSEPVTIPCGHSYCMACIADYWKSEGQKGGAYSCPECRQTFKPCPQLCRNTMLAEAVEQLRRGNLSAAARESIRSASRAARSASARAAARTSAPLPPSAVPCDRCTEPRAALKTCLVCMASLCETHLKPHQTKAKLKGHELIGPTGDLSQKICPHHKYLQEFHCRTCQKFVCWICTSNQHKGHETVSTQTERTEKQKTLTTVHTENHQKLQKREVELKDMKKVLETLKRSSDTVKAEADTVLLELQHSVQRLQQLIQDVMSSTGQEKLSEAQDMVDKLEAEIKQLKKKDTELKNLVSSEDNIYFLKSYEALCSPDLSLLGSVSVSVNADVSFEPVRSLIYELRERVEDMCNQELDKINKTVFSTTAFTVTDQQNGQKPAILKLFSGLGAKSSNNRTQGPPALPSVSVRGTGPGSFAQDVRSRNDPRVDRRTNSPRPKATQGRVEREEESSPRPLQRPNLNTSDEQADTQSIRSHGSRTRQKREERDQDDTWSLSSIRPRDRQKREERQTANGDLQNPVRPQQTPVARQQPERQSDRWSLSSLLPRNRKKKQDSVREATPTHQEEPTSASTCESPVDVNPGLFLDSPTEFTMTPAFPVLREIDMDSIEAPEPRTRDEFLQYACALTLDPNTAHQRLALMEEGTRAELQVRALPYPECPQRFDGWTQVLCLQPLVSERSYWEVEWRGRGSSLGVASAAMTRKGADARAGLGYNSQSWSLELSDMCCAAMHANQKKEIPVTYCPRVGVFLDRGAGTLSFYAVDDNLLLVHEFRGSFSEPLFAAFGVGSGVGVGLDFAMGQFSSTADSIKICRL
ncbi:E3 ubiquitin/ISG15 ligase TRIM25 [Electrophorus electricus]|uniref:E3 ubiquitin/ISG15 ligase TRIM25 n=1 Tax=Electrophorus electricus TaxID=8005 RepID=UPI0015D0A663|nr:E3 ubiquitin/ISG15 ligase TRIM25 [Electrophorus electricus]